MKDVIREIVNGADSAAVVGGHYCVAPDLEELSADAETEQSTFAFAAEVVASFRAQGKRATLLLWVNDIGIGPSERDELKRDYQLPAPYAALLARAGLDRGALTVLFESTVRNKASVLLRDLFKHEPSLFRVLDSDAPELLRCIDRCAPSEEPGKKAYVMTGPDGENLVVKEGPNPKCNLILGTLFHLIATRLKPETIVTVFNSIYVNRIRLGLHVARQLFSCQVAIRSLFMDGELLLATPPTVRRTSEGTQTSGATQ